MDLTRYLSKFIGLLVFWTKYNAKNPLQQLAITMHYLFHGSLKPKLLLPMKQWDEHFIEDNKTQRLAFQKPEVCEMIKNFLSFVICLWEPLLKMGSSGSSYFVSEYWILNNVNLVFKHFKVFTLGKDQGLIASGETFQKLEICNYICRRLQLLLTCDLTDSYRLHLISCGSNVIYK